jgi:hypothetical protein
MEPRNALSLPVFRRDLLDNSTDYIVVGDTSIDRKISLEYSYELPIADKALTGTFVFNQNGSSVDLDNWYSFLDESLTENVVFGAVIVGTEIRLTIITNSVGENPTIKYRRNSIGVV